MADQTTKLAFCNALSKYHDSADLSDFTIVCREKSWKTHRLLLSLHSKVMAKVCNSDFKETKDRTIDLSEYTIADVAALMSYVYKWDYSIASDVKNTAAILRFHTQMCFIADKYDIAGLKQLSVKKFRVVLWQVTLGDEIAAAAQLAYSGPLAVKEICSSIVAEINEKKLIGVDTKSKSLEKVMEASPQLAIDTLRVRGLPKQDESNGIPKYVCPSSCAAVNYLRTLSTPSGLVGCNTCGKSFSANVWRDKKI